ncbi:portal protein [Pseudomonas phage vB_PcuM_ KLEP17-4]|nr:portal protein [Pseudomonas phage vB_PcuM_ KLEP17-4]
MWPRKTKPEPATVEQEVRRGVFSTDLGGMNPPSTENVVTLRKAIPNAGEAMDSAVMLGDAGQVAGIPEAQFGWYASQGFIGYQACAILAQHWLIDKACSMPARDAIRQGYEINCDDKEAIEVLKKADKRHNINGVMSEFVRLGRVFGVRVAIFRVDSTDPEYYQKPFNLDGVTRGSYRGVSQVDPFWCSPILTNSSLIDPASQRYYEPEFWLIGGTKYHRSHLAIFIPNPVSDLIKPSYQYGGVSVPQRIYERVYAAERTANEAPQLAMTKRLTVLKVNAVEFYSNLQRAYSNLAEWVGLRNSYGVKVIDKVEEDIDQHDVSLADLDNVIMTQYQIVAAIAGVPATKLMGTTPKGFNSSGEYEEASYREELESIQTNDLTPLIERHHACVLRSNGYESLESTVDWNPLDSPTAEEWATINKAKADTAAVYAGIGAIDGMDVRGQITKDKTSDFYGLAEIDESLPPIDETDLVDASAETPAAQ